MNLSAIFCHCLSTFKGSALGIQWADIARIDCGFTGASAVNLMLASLQTRSNGSIKHISQHFFSLVVAGIVIYYPFLANSFGIPYGNEVSYLATTIVGSLTSFFALFTTKKTNRQWAWFMVSAVGMLLVLSGLFIDAWLCDTFGSKVNLFHIVFGGCNIAYFAILIMLREPFPASQTKLKYL